MPTNRSGFAYDLDHGFDGFNAFMYDAFGVRPRAASSDLPVQPVVMVAMDTDGFCDHCAEPIPEGHARPVPNVGIACSEDCEHHLLRSNG